MRLGKALSRTAVRALPFGSRDIHGEDLAQFTGGGVTVKVVCI
jgi:hypothetical protein